MLKLGTYNPYITVKMFSGLSSLEPNWKADYLRDPNTLVNDLKEGKSVQYPVNNYVSPVGLYRGAPQNANYNYSSIVIDTPSGAIDGSDESGEVPFNNGAATPYQYVVELMETYSLASSSNYPDWDYRGLVLPTVAVKSNWSKYKDLLSSFNVQVPIKFNSNYAYGVYLNGDLTNNQSTFTSIITTQLGPLFGAVGKLHVPFKVVVIVNAQEGDTEATLTTPIINQATTSGLDQKYLDIFVIDTTGSFKATASNVYTFTMAGWNTTDNGSFATHASAGSWVVSTDDDQSAKPYYTSFLNVEKADSANITNKELPGLGHLPDLKPNTGSGTLLNQGLGVKPVNIVSTDKVSLSFNDLKTLKKQVTTGASAVYNDAMLPVIVVAKRATNTVDTSTYTNQFTGYSNSGQKTKVNINAYRVDGDDTPESFLMFPGASQLMDTQKADANLGISQLTSYDLQNYNGVNQRLDAYNGKVTQLTLDDSNQYKLYENGSAQQSDNLLLAQDLQDESSSTDGKLINRYLTTQTQLQAEDGVTWQSVIDKFNKLNLLNPDTLGGTLNYQVQDDNYNTPNLTDPVSAGNWTVTINLNINPNMMLQYKVNVKPAEKLDGWNITVILSKTIVPSGTDLSAEEWWS